MWSWGEVNKLVDTISYLCYWAINIYSKNLNRKGANQTNYLIKIANSKKPSKAATYMQGPGKEVLQVS